MAESVMLSANGGHVCASVLPPRLGLTSRPPMGTHETTPLCTTSTPWGQTSTCRLSGLLARSSRTTTRKHLVLLPPPLFCSWFPGFLRSSWVDFLSAKPGLNNTLLLKISLGENHHIGGDAGGEGEDSISPLPCHCCWVC